jgi:hypothetical protein
VRGSFGPRRASASSKAWLALSMASPKRASSIARCAWPARARASASGCASPWRRSSGSSAAKLAPHLVDATAPAVYVDHQQARAQRERVRDAEVLLCLVDGALRDRLGAGDLAEPDQALAGDSEQLHAQPGACRLDGVDARRGACQQVLGGERAAAVGVGIRVAEDRRDEAPHLVGAPLLGLRHARLPRCDAGTGDEREHHRGYRRRAQPMAREELRRRYAALSGRASTGWRSRCRCRSSASASAVV